MDELKPPPMSDEKHELLMKGRATLDYGYAVEAARDAQWLALVGELQRDAARYRWVRLRYDGEGSIDLAFVPDPYWGPKNGDGLDAAIDAARGEKGGV